jgi:hypothetical protein
MDWFAGMNAILDADSFKSPTAFTNFLAWAKEVKIGSMELRGNIGKLSFDPKTMFRSPLLLRKLVVALDGRRVVPWPQRLPNARVTTDSLPRIKEMCRVFTNLRVLHVLLPPHQSSDPQRLNLLDRDLECPLDHGKAH